MYNRITGIKQAEEFPATPSQLLAHILSSHHTKDLVLAPFDRVQVNPFLYQLPQRAQFPQERDSLFHGLEHIVNLGLGRKPSNTKANTTVCTLVTVPKSSEHVAWLERRRRACAAGRQRDIFEGHEKRFALDVSEGDVDATRIAAGGVAVLGGMLEGHEAIHKAGRKVRNAFGVIL